MQNTSSKTFVLFTGSFISDCLLQSSLQSHLLLQFADVTDPLPIHAALFSRSCSLHDSGFRSVLLGSHIILQDEFRSLACNMPLKSAAIVTVKSTR